MMVKTKFPRESCLDVFYFGNLQIPRFLVLFNWLEAVWKELLALLRSLDPPVWS